eukprot:gb/GECG01010836.1/.p1 GENE.gb/GECG01010836.1/~~gb/GECG01010836.1/.p1  ORF type:complete len:1505 (+),score=382.48 gb/GECG01010836.1/:1-4515(+)
MSVRTPGNGEQPTSLQTPSSVQPGFIEGDGSYPQWETETGTDIEWNQNAPHEVENGEDHEKQQTTVANTGTRENQPVKTASAWFSPQEEEDEENGETNDSVQENNKSSPSSSSSGHSSDAVGRVYVDVHADTSPTESTPSYSFLTPHDKRMASSVKQKGQFRYDEIEDGNQKDDTTTQNGRASWVAQSRPSSGQVEATIDSEQQQAQHSVDEAKKNMKQMEAWKNQKSGNDENTAAPQYSLHKKMDEKSYIPVELAQEYLRRAMEDMRAMKQRHVEAIQNVDKHHKAKMSRSREEFEKEKRDIRKRAGERILLYQQRLQQKESELKELEESRKKKSEQVQEQWSNTYAEIQNRLQQKEVHLRERTGMLQEEIFNLLQLRQQLNESVEQYQSNAQSSKENEEKFTEELQRVSLARKRQVYAREAQISSQESELQYWRLTAQVLQENMEDHLEQPSSEGAGPSMKVEEEKREISALEERAKDAERECERLKAQKAAPKEDSEQNKVANNFSYIEGLLQITPGDIPKLSEEVERCEKMLAMSKSELDSVQTEYNNAHDEYKSVKHEIKDWIAEYESEHGAKPDKDAKKAIKDKYRRYETLQQQVHEKPDQVQEAKQRVEDADAELRIAKQRLHLAQELASIKPDGPSVQAEDEEVNVASKPEVSELPTAEDRGESGVAEDSPNTQALLQEKERLEDDVARYEERIAELESELESMTLQRDLAKAQITKKQKEPSKNEEEQQQQANSDIESIVQKLKRLLDKARDAIDRGASLWREEKKRDALHLYQRVVSEVVDELGDEQAFARMKDELNSSVDEANGILSSSPGKAAVILRQGLDEFVRMTNNALDQTDEEPADTGEDALQQKVQELESRLQQFQSSNETKSEGKTQEVSKWRRRALNAEKTNDNLNSKIKELEKTKENLESKIKQLERQPASSSEKPSKGKQQVGASNTRDKEKIDQLQNNLKELRQKLKDAESRANDNQMASQLKEAQKAQSQAEKKLEMAEKKAKKEQEELKKEKDLEITKVQKKLERTEKTLSETEEQVSQLTKEKNDLKVKVNNLDSAEKELETLREKAEEAKKVQQELDELKKEHEEISNAYREEQLLRKKYWNMMEDMKGKIRVYCRSRPLSNSEIGRGNYSVVKIPDSCTVDIETQRGPKEFVYDSVFGEETTQANVFEESENLVQSAFDGYNVCIFAYGQTGSGKTFTMLGNEQYPGIAPRAVQRLFELIEENKKMISTKVSVYMVELYNDQFQDLLWRADNLKAKQSDAPRLEIKKDKNGMVLIKGSQMKSAESADEVMNIFHSGNTSRATSSTSMNDESSRSHLIFAIMLEAYNRKTGKTSIGKLSLVDLAGSERQSKTGATKERFKEAQSINLSLSALGNVISQLSNGEKFIRYRDNKLTQLMQDSIGGNAKTLMFVNISPADYNREETLTSLRYASRVKMITNNASKQQESEEVNRLQKCVDKLKEHFGPEAEKVIADIDQETSAEPSGAPDEREDNEIEATE